jgi:hypothetical protein
MPAPEKLPLSPMLVQYLVGLCVLKWNAEAVDIDVILGDMVPDEGSETERDVDVTVTVETPDGVYAFKGYEVKHWSTPLDVSDIDALVTKFDDMPSVTHRAIVSTSGFSEPAIKKAEHHGVDLYVIKPWTEPLETQFPDLAPMAGVPSSVINTLSFNLIWPGEHQRYWLGVPGAPDFEIARDQTLFDTDGKKHPVYGDFGTYADAMVVRSVGILLHLKPIRDRVMPSIEAFRTRAPMPEEPRWPWAHTLDATSDDVYVHTSDGGLHRVDTFTLYGQLGWERGPVFHRVMEKVPTGEIFAGAVVAPSDVPGRMWAIIIPAEGRTWDIRQVQLETKHLNQIRELKLARPEDNPVSS